MYDKEMAKKVSRVSRSAKSQTLVSLLKDHGLEPSACKTDLYTMIGIDSNHPSKLRSTIWRVIELIDGGPEAVKVSCWRAIWPVVWLISRS